MNVKTILLLVCLAIVAAFGWKHFNVDIQKIRDEAGIKPTAVVMLWVAECGDVCLDEAKKMQRRGIEVVNMDINDSASGSQLWKAVGGGNGPFPSFLIGEELFRSGQDGDLRTKLLSVYGESVLTAREKKYFKKHFDAGVTPRAVLYTAEWCGYCKQLRSDLQSSNTPFTEIDVEKHVNPEELSEVMTIPGFPTVYFGYEKLNGDVSDIASQIRANLKK
jgi:glutaredoxin